MISAYVFSTRYQRAWFELSSSGILCCLSASVSEMVAVNEIVGR